MKPFLPAFALDPLKAPALPAFFALAFFPCLLRLTFPDMSIAPTLLALGPVIAGAWLATSLRAVQVNFMLLGTLVTALLWAANWLMLAGRPCCQTLGN